MVGVFNDVNSGKSVTDIISAARDLFGKHRERESGCANFVPEIMPRSPDNVHLTMGFWSKSAGHCDYGFFR